jgi:beta-lactamase superfamily II metal-dependent hydrolase/PKD repeat protein
MDQLLCLRKALAIVGLAAVTGLAAVPALGFTPREELEIHYINVQQGNSVLIVGPGSDGKRVLLDAGSPGKGGAEIVPYFQQHVGLMPEETLHSTLASHLHADHIGGFAEVFAAGYDVEETNWYNVEVEPPLPEGAVLDYFTAAGQTSAREPVPIPLGHRIALGDGAVLTVVAVGGEVLGGTFVDGAQNDLNDLSVAVLVQYGDFDFLWAADVSGGKDEADALCTGRPIHGVDVETPLVRALTEGPQALLTGGGVEVLHVNHHGSKTSTNSEWMNRLRPQVAVIPVGSHRGFGFPHKPVVENVLQAGGPCIDAPPALVLQTDEGSPENPQTSFEGHVVGDVVIRSDGHSYRVSASGDTVSGVDERAAAGLPEGFCLPGDTTLCLNDERFEVTVAWRTAAGDSGVGQAVPLTSDTGYFWFFDPANVELVVKVLDACSFAGRYWVFAGGLTNVRTEITVKDTESGQMRTYVNPQRTAFQPLQDTDAFATCPDDCVGNQPPEARFAVSCDGLTCSFTDLSSDPDGAVASRGWSFGDGETSTAADPSHTYAMAGAYEVELTVTDTCGATDFHGESVTVPEVGLPPLLLSEVFYDAEGGDDGLEWVELFNPGTTAVDLAGYSLGNGGDDYTYSKVQLEGFIAPGATFVVGGPTSSSRNGRPSFDQVHDFEPDFQNSTIPSDPSGDGVALFAVPSREVTAATVPIDAVVYGSNNDNGLIDETGAAQAPEVADAPAGASVERIDLAGHWRVQALPTPNRSPLP